MKKAKVANPPAEAQEVKTRTVKISGDLHYKLRLISLKRDLSMQQFLNDVLTRAIKQYEKEIAAA